MQTWLSRIATSLGLLLMAVMLVVLLDTSLISAPLLSLIVIRLTASRHLARVWAALLAIVVEMYSPLPGLIYGLSILGAYLFLELYVLRFISRHNFLGIFVCGFFSVIIAGLILLMLAHLPTEQTAAWLISANWQYFRALLLRGIVTAGIAGGVIVFGIRLHSPRLRGIIIASSQ